MRLLRIALVIGTRPEIIKMNPIIRECQKRSLDFVIIHTGQHYSRNLSEDFLNQLGYPPIAYNLNIGSGSHGEETGRAIMSIERALKAVGPDVVLVEGDTNSVLSGVIAAVKLGIDVGHVEAGLRSFDRTMPEEVNRILADHASTYLFAPTKISKSNLFAEGLKSHVYITGNTIVDAIHDYLNSHKAQAWSAPENDYFLVTIHRQENVDDPSRFSNIMRGLTALHREIRVPIIYPVHPRAKKQIERFGLTTRGITMTEAVDYFRFIELERGARLILTDSGGVQEEACILKIPCVTIRDSTERPETLSVGANILAKANARDIVGNAKIMLRKKRAWQNPFGNGRAAVRIVNVIEKKY